jgi:hypothetical protein
MEQHNGIYISVFLRITVVKTVKVFLWALLGLLGDANQIHSFKLSCFSDRRLSMFEVLGRQSMPAPTKQKIRSDKPWYTAMFLSQTVKRLGHGVILDRSFYYVVHRVIWRI